MEAGPGYRPNISAQPFEVVNLAEETKFPILLPTALYKCCLYDTRQISMGIGSGDSVVKLSPKNIQVCIAAWDKLCAVKRHTIFAFLTRGIMSQCTTPYRCDATRLQFLGTLPHDANILCPFFDWASFERRVCSSCFSASQASYHDAQEQAWNNLPSFFNLSSWERLGRASGVPGYSILEICGRISMRTLMTAYIFVSDLGAAACLALKKMVLGVCWLLLNLGAAVYKVLSMMILGVYWLLVAVLYCLAALCQCLCNVN